MNTTRSAWFRWALCGLCLVMTSSFARSSREISTNEALALAINEHRAQHGLPSIQISESLNRVAEMHARDLQENRPDRGACNMHSWSESTRWTPCCYTDRSPKDECMWNKPREITRGRYRGNGYEIAAWLSERIDPGDALTLWEKSKGHHDIILNRGMWSRLQWRAMGAAMSDNYAVVWFGAEMDR